MDISIKKAVIHILDTNIDIPILSKKLIELDSDSEQYFNSLISKTTSDDSCKICSFLDDSTFIEYLKRVKNEFLPVTQEIAQEIFAILRRNASIPAADFTFLFCCIDKQPYLAVLKLDYKTSFIHHLEYKDDEEFVEMVKQRTVLPSQNNKLSEAFFINLQDYSIKLIEKTYEIDGMKSTYLSNYILQCSLSSSAKEKLTAFMTATRKVNEIYYNASNQMDTVVASTIYNEVETHPKLSDLCEKIYSDNPSAIKEFHKQLDEQRVSGAEVLNISEKAVRKLEKRALKSDLGVEVKIPIDLYKNKDAIEFINNLDGSVSLLIKKISI